MKTRINSIAFIKSFIISIILLWNSGYVCAGGYFSGMNVYVTDFKYPIGSPQMSDSTSKLLTEAFEEALISERQVRVLERRRYDLVKINRKNEQVILKLDGHQHEIVADAFFCGELRELERNSKDKAFSLTIALIGMNGRKYAKHTIELDKKQLSSPIKCRQLMEKLVHITMGIRLEDENNIKHILTTLELEYKIKVQIANFVHNPILKEAIIKREFSTIINNPDIVSNFEKQHPYTAAQMYRVYGAAIILTGYKNNAKLITLLKNGFIYFEKSRQLSPNLWQNEHDAKSYEFFKQCINNPKDVVASDFFFALFSVALIDKSKEEISEATDLIVDILTQHTTDFKFFENYEFTIDDGKRKFNYKMIIDALRIMGAPEGWKVKGPLFYNAVRGGTLIQYFVDTPNGQTWELLWLVDKEKGIIEPQTDKAGEFHKFVNANR